MHTTRRQLILSTAAAATMLNQLLSAAQTANNTSPKARDLDGDAQLEKRAFMESARAEILTRNKALSDSQFKSGNTAVFQRLAVPIPFPDFYFYYTDGEIVWAPPAGVDLPIVRVPKGFVTDLASIPRPMWSVFPKTGPYAYAAIVHDYLYWTRLTEKSVADQVMAQAMKDSGSSAATIKAFELALATAGSLGWDNNKKLRDAGEKRVLRKFPTDLSISWQKWKTEPDVFSEM